MSFSATPQDIYFPTVVVCNHNAIQKSFVTAFNLTSEQTNAMAKSALASF